MIGRLDPYTFDSFACLVIVFDYLGMEIGIWYDNFALNLRSMFLFHKLGVFLYPISRILKSLRLDLLI